MPWNDSNPDVNAHRIQRAPLIAHPTTESGCVRSITATAKTDGSRLFVHYAVEGAVAEIAAPPVCAPERKDGLWKQTCFEAFIGDGAAYYEFNFSPSTEWAAYRFDGYRAGMKPADIAAPKIERSATATGFDLYTEVAIDALQLAGAPPWRLGLSAVIKDRDGAASYWALAHADGAPDFHHAGCFALQIP